MKKKIELVDPMTVDWPTDAFKVGDEVMAKPGNQEYWDEYEIDPKKPFIITRRDESSLCPFWIDSPKYGKGGASINEDIIVPLSKIQEYEAAKAGKKPVFFGKAPKAPKSTLLEKALAAAEEKIQKAVEHKRAIQRIIDIDKEMKDKDAAKAKLKEEREELAKKHLRGIK